MIHKVKITGGPLPQDISVRLDGRPIYPYAVSVRIGLDNVAEVVMSLNAEVYLDLDADVIARITRDVTYEPRVTSME